MECSIQRQDPPGQSEAKTSLAGVKVEGASRRQFHSLGAWARTVLTPQGMMPARHQVLLMEHLADVAEGHCDRLMVLMPPGSAKSTYCSLLFPAWWLHRHPTNSIIAASHTAELASTFGRGVRRLAQEHRDYIGYRIERESHAAHRFQTDLRGDYFATGLGGSVTGRRADLVVVDDPLRGITDAESATHRDFVWNWYRGELVSRLKPGGRIVLVMTRWHVDDLAGRLLASDDGWRVLRLPALAEANDPLNRAPDEALWPAWEDRNALERKRIVSGQRMWAALYQQAPLTDSGVLFRVNCVEFSDAAPPDLQCVRAWDLAATSASAGRDPDWTVGLKLGRSAIGRSYVLDVVRFRGGPHEVAERIVITAQHDGTKVPIGLPQDPGQAGKQQVAWLTGMLAGYRVMASPETGAKTTRAAPAAAQVEAGNVVLIRADWNRAFLDELREFPNGRKDDQVDALSRAFAMASPTAAPSRRLNIPLMVR